jgi:hypothetical protein
MKEGIRMNVLLSLDAIAAAPLVRIRALPTPANRMRQVARLTKYARQPENRPTNRCARQIKPPSLQMRIAAGVCAALLMTVTAVSQTDGTFKAPGPGQPRPSGPAKVRMLSCTSSLSCSGIAYGLPNLVLHCSSAVNFYQGSMNGMPVSTNATNFSSKANDVPGWGVTACSGQQPLLAGGFKGGTCTFYPAYASPTYCGALPPQPPNFCEECQKTGGTCKVVSGKKICIHQ